jgi:hypothetical protein
MAEHKKEETKKFASAYIDTVDFKTQIEPFLQKKCTPYHFPGGKMYDKMPFDKSETIIALSDKIVKRIKDEPELSLLKQFISQHK